MSLPVINASTGIANQCVGTNGLSNKNSNREFPMLEVEYDELAQNSELFWEKLEAYHQFFDNKFSPPMIGGEVLDLHRLFVEVSSRGGLEKVIRDRKWKEVTVIFTFQTAIPSSSFVLRKYYLSLLYPFEQMCFNAEFPSISTSVTSDVVEEGVTQFQSQEVSKLEVGSSVSGSIDAKFDNGYLVAVNVGSEELKGVLYHFPIPSETPLPPPQQNRKKPTDPSKPKPNRSGYTFFFAEQYPKLKPLYSGQEKAISTEIGILWSQLPHAEKQVYQEKGRKDKERYQMEMLEYSRRPQHQPSTFL